MLHLYIVQLKVKSLLHMALHYFCNCGSKAVVKSWAAKKWKDGWFSRIEITTTINCPVYLGMLWTPVPITFPKGKTPRDLNLKVSFRIHVRM